jgi:2'-5' RNA ligase
MTMRLFVALDINSEIRERICEFREQVRAYAPDVRWVGPETFHVTLQFLGETENLDTIQPALQRVRAAPVNLSFGGAGFFPTPRSPRVFWVGIQADKYLQELVDSIGGALQRLGFKRDAGQFTPHLTLARAGSGRPKQARGEPTSAGLRALAIKLETLAMPDFGTMTAREFCLYQSTLSPSGAKYTKLATYPLE